MNTKEILLKTQRTINILSNFYLYLTILVFLFNSILINILLKRRPMACLDNPKNIILTTMDSLFDYLFMCLFFVIPIIVINIILLFVIKNGKKPKKLILLNIIGIVFIFLLFVFDPFGYFAWFLD